MGSRATNTSTTSAGQRSTVDQRHRLLLAESSKGHAHAFDDLIRETTTAVRCALIVRCSSDELVEEIMQRTYLEAFRHAHTYRSEGTVLAWLRGIAVNTLRTEWRHQERQRATPDDELASILQNMRCEVDEALHSKANALSTTLKGCLQRLGQRQQTMLRQRYIEGASLKILAQRWKKKRDALAKSMSRLLLKLRHCVEEGIGHDLRE